MNDVEKTMLIVAIGFAAGRGCDFNIQRVLRTLSQKRKKVSAEKEDLLRVFEFAKAKGLYQFFSNSDLQILESEIKYEI